MIRIVICLITFIITGINGAGWCADLDQIRQNGKLRHLGIIYANFVTEDGNGLDVELMKMFAAHLGVRYELVETDWADILADLTGKVVKPVGDNVEIIGEAPVRGDIIATGFTVLPWRKQIVDFSEMTFPTAVWLVSGADSNLQPIKPTGNINQDIAAVKKNLNGVSVLGLKDSCLDPALYRIDETGAAIQYFPSDRNLSEMIPMVMAKMAETTLIDVPVALVSLEKWPGKVKIVGPVSESQEMAAAFAKTSPKLREAFNAFFQKCKAGGTYKRLVSKYYPSLFMYYPDF